MHTFQTYPSDMFEIDPFTKIGSEWMLITSGNREKANALGQKRCIYLYP